MLVDKHHFKSKFLFTALLFMLCTSLLMAQDPGAASGNGITPVVVAGNPNTNDIGYDYGFKIENAPNGTFYFTNQDGELTGGAPEEPGSYVTISNSGGILFDWVSNKGILAVIVKGGDNANVYYYDPASLGDTRLHPPVNPNNDKYFEISHIEFCYNAQVPQPGLDIEKATNGMDADDPTGPEIEEGDKVTWTYKVTNTGNVTLTNIQVTDDILGDIGTIPSLAPGESTTLTFEGIAGAGQYVNVGTASAMHDDEKVEDSDPSHYFGIRGEIDIEKSTNSVDADQAPGVYLYIGDAVEWTFVVTNTGNVPLTNVVVTDDKLGEICTIEYLGVGEQSTCTVQGIAQEGQYENIGKACGLYWGDVEICDEDPSHYYGSEKPTPSIDIEKATNGEDADQAPGPLVLEGSTVTWTYVVTNTGNVPLYNVVVTDDKVGDICTIDMLAVGESKECEATGEAGIGQYENVGMVVGWYDDEKVEDRDLSH